MSTRMNGASNNAAGQYCFDDVTVEHAQFRLYKAGALQKITPRAFEVLVYLIKQRGRLVEKQELFEQVWKESFVTDNALTRMVKEIRHVIGDSAESPRYIETVPRHGYRFIGELTSPAEVNGGSLQASDPRSNAFENGSQSGEADFLALGRRALEKGSWEEARQHFEAALKVEESAEAQEGLGLAAWWLDDAEATFAARERAYLLYRQASDARGAGRLAIWLAWDYATFRGEIAIANGWLQRAQRLLEMVPLCVEQGWLLVRQGYNALSYGDDPEKARELATQAVALGQQLGDVDLELAAQSVEGLSMICTGEVADGIQLLDEVTAAFVAGEMSDWVARGQTVCNLITGCERIRDYERAAEWCKHFKEFCEQGDFRTLFAVCRTQYAEVLMWRGEWSEAEAELIQANNDLQFFRPGLTALALVRLAKLRARQGNTTEARKLLSPVEHAPVAQCVRAELAIEEGDTQSAIEISEQYLRRLPSKNLIERANCLEMLIRGYLAQNQGDAAGKALTELATITEVVNTKPLKASLSFSAGLVAAAGGDGDAARQRFEDAVDLYRQCGASYETGLALIELAGVLRVLGKHSSAALTAQQAYDRLIQIGANATAARALAIVDELRNNGRIQQD